MLESPARRAAAMQVILVGAYPPPHGGLQTNLVGIRECLRRHGHGCAVINITRHRRPDSDEVYYPRTGLGVLRLLGRLPSQIVHVHIGGNLTWRLLALCLACTLLPRKKTVLTFHSGGYASSPEGRAARYGTLRGMVFRRLDAIVAVNAEIADLFGRFGLPPDRVRLIPPYAAPALDGNIALPERIRRFFETHRPVLATVGLLEPEYDLGLQIETLGAIRREFSEAGLVLIGAGSLERDLRDRIARQPWSEHILLCGDVAHKATLRVIAASDALLRTTLYDGDAISVREALHLGTPVIATDNGMRPAGVHLIAMSDSGALAQAVSAVIRSGKRTAPRAASGEDNLEAVVRLYRELLSTPGAANRRS
jgi:glycosyltransferase involved in cell wall biosynthesis